MLVSLYCLVKDQDSKQLIKCFIENSSFTIEDFSTYIFIFWTMTIFNFIQKVAFFLFLINVLNGWQIIKRAPFFNLLFSLKIIDKIVILVYFGVLIIEILQIDVNILFF